MTRESKEQDREGAEGGGLSGVELDLRAPPRCLHDEKHDDVRNAGEHEGAEVLEGVELLCVGERAHDDAHDDDPEPPLCGHLDVPLLVLLHRRGARADLVVVKVGLAHDGERVADHNEVRDQDARGQEEHDEVEDGRQVRCEPVADPGEVDVDVGVLAVVLLLLLFEEGVGGACEEIHAAVAEGPHDQDEDDAEDDTELVHRHGETEDTGTHGGVHKRDVAGEDGGGLLDPGELAVVGVDRRAIDLDDVVVFLKRPVGLDESLGCDFELEPAAVCAG